MKPVLNIGLLLFLLPMAATAQVKIPKDANRFTYWQIDYGEQNDTSTLVVERTGNVVTLLPQRLGGDPVRGYAQTVTSVDYAADSMTVRAFYDDTVYFYRAPLTRNDIEWEEHGDIHTCHINSNRMEFEMDTKTLLNVNPLPYYGLTRGVLRSYSRNGQQRLVLAKAEKVKAETLTAMVATGPLRRVQPRELDRLMKERLVVTTRIFDHEQICWGKENAHVGGSIWNVPFQQVLHYAGGTLVMKRVRLPHLPAHYQHFVELHQQSAGDAYDRTGSVFVIPITQGTARQGFFRGINEHPDSLPTLTARDGERYQGMALTEGYAPATEWVRFFTPFGVGHFNERMADYGIVWRPETYYRQEITDVYEAGDVLVCAWIGNYDAGGHRITLDIKSYPNLRTIGSETGTRTVQPLFNTCNVLEMAGQNYGKLFATDSLTVTFAIPADATRARLRYISTGHGGWGEGDEFVPKQNTILIDGKVAFTHTPWREDCGCYRDLNPVSGNFWNGLSSSDLSRSGWCPGTATQPVYFDLTPWADGREHTLTVAIPQGKPVEGMFSHWAVSGTLIVEL